MKLIYDNQNNTQRERSVNDVEKFVLENSKQPNSILSVKGSNTQIRGKDEVQTLAAETRKIDEGEQVKTYEAYKTATSIDKIDISQTERSQVSFQVV